MLLNYIKNFLENNNKNLEAKINSFKIEDLQNEIIKNKLELLKINLNECNQNSNRELELLKSIESTSSEFKNKIEYHTNNLIIDNEKTHNLIDEILTIFIEKDKFIGDNNIFKIFKNFINNWNHFLSNLTFEQLMAIAHLTSSICILINILTIISILFGDKLINYFKLEERFPKLSFIFKLRTKFNNFSLALSFIMIISILLALIYVNSLILIHF